MPASQISEQIEKNREAVQKERERHFWEMVFCSIMQNPSHDLKYSAAGKADFALEEWRKRWGA